MEAAQTSALALYVGLNLLLTFLLAVNVVRHRFKGDSADPGDPEDCQMNSFLNV